MSKMLNEYIAKKVQYIAKINNKKSADLAAGLNVSESFINKVHSHTKHYNVAHLYILSRLLDCEVSDFYPDNYTTYKRLYPLSGLQDNEFENWLIEVENEIKYRKDDL